MNAYELCKEYDVIDNERDNDYYNDNNVYFFDNYNKKKKNKRKELEEKIWG